MHPDPVIECFREDFERFSGMLESQIDACPDALWESRAGGYPYWQQLLHVFACMELFALPQGDGVLALSGEPLGVVMLTAAPERTISKAEMRVFAVKMREVADSFITRQNRDTLTDPHPVMTKRFGKPQTVQHALLALIRHACYHIGCLDAFLRDHTGKGVY